MGSTTEPTLIDFISVDNNAQRLCNLHADLPEERLNGKIPALKSASLLCSTPSVWTPNFWAECHCVHSITLLKMWVFQLIFFLLKWNNSFSYTFLWVYGISAIKSTCSHCMVHLVLRRVEKNLNFHLSETLSGFYQIRRQTFQWLWDILFYIPSFKPWKSVGAMNLT